MLSPGSLHSCVPARGPAPPRACTAETKAATTPLGTCVRAYTHVCVRVNKLHHGFGIEIEAIATRN